MIYFTYGNPRERVRVMRTRFIWIFLLMLAGIPLFAEIDPVLAKIKLTELEVVTQREFKKQVVQLENTLKRPFSLEQKKQLLDVFIGNKIILQAADRERIRVSQAEVGKMLDLYKQDLGLRSGLNRKLSDDELEAMLSKEGFTWEKLTTQVKEQITIEKYVAQVKKHVFANIPAPTDDEIQEYYESNRTRYPIVSPEMVSYKQIFISTRNLSSGDADKAKRKMEQIYRELQNGESFDKYLEVYLDGNPRKAGGLSFETWRRDDTAQKLTFGKNFFDTVFKLKKARRSRILKSNIGYHILEIIDKIEFKVLSLDDKIPPKNTMTVRDFITQGLLQGKQKEPLQKATAEVLEDLKKEADIQIFENNLDW